MVLQGFDHDRIAGLAGFEHHEGLDDHAPVFIGHADHAAFGHRRMLEQRVFNLRPGHVVARRDDHVVIARLVEKVIVGVLHEGVAGVVPAVFDVIALALVLQIAAAGRADHRQPANGAARHFRTVVIDHFGGVTGNDLADGTRAHIVGRRGNEDMKHLGRADAVDDLDAGRVFPELAGGVRQAFAGADAQPQCRHAMQPGKGGHLAVKGRCGVAEGCAHLLDELDHRLGSVGNRRVIDRRAGPHRKDQHATQAEGESQRRRTHDDVVGPGLKHLARPGFAGGQNVAVAVNRRLGFAGGA